MDMASWAWRPTLGMASHLPGHGVLDLTLVLDMVSHSVRWTWRSGHGVPSRAEASVRIHTLYRNLFKRVPYRRLMSYTSLQSKRWGQSVPSRLDTASWASRFIRGMASQFEAAQGLGTSRPRQAQSFGPVCFIQIVAPCLSTIYPY